MKNVFTVLILFVCLTAVGQHKADFNVQDKTESNDFSKDFTVEVANFTNADKLSVTLPNGDLIDITTAQLHGSSHNATTSILTIKFKIAANQVFLDAGNESKFGSIIISRGATKLLTILKLSTSPTPGSPGPKAFDPTGFALMDAISLVNCTKRSQAETILKFYIGDAGRSTISNRFLKDPAIDVLIQSKEDDAKVVGLASTIAKKAVTAAGGLDVTTFADGLAKFLVKRSKEELSAAFFDRFKKEMMDPRYEDLRTIFPETHRTLETIGDDIYMFQAYIQTLREAFQNDLAALLAHLPGILTNHKKYFDQHPELEAVLKSAFYVGREIQDKKHPGEIIEGYPLEYIERFGNVKASFQSIKLLSMSLRDESSDNYWADASTIKKLTARDGLLLKLYLGMLEEQSDTIVFYDKDRNKNKLSDVIDAAYDDIKTTVPAYRRYLGDLSDRLNSLEASIKDLKGSKPDSIVFENYYAVVSQSIDLMRHLSDAESLPKFPQNLHVRDSVAKYFDAMEGSSNLAIDIHRRNYASAIMDAVYLYNLAVEEFHIPFLRKSEAQRLELTKNQADSIVARAKNIIAYFDLVKEAKTPAITDVPSLLKAAKDLMPKKKINIEVDAISAAEIAQSILSSGDAAYRATLVQDEGNAIAAHGKALKALQDFAEKRIDASRSPIGSLMMKYGSFMAAVTTAKNSDEVEAAIEAVALPAGSSRIKRTVRFNVALNSYLGLHIGEEHINVTGTDKKGWSSIYGISAPVGIAASWRLGKKAGSATLFVPMIDIGAVTAFRFKDNTTSDLPPLKLENIFAPGLYAVYGIPKCPISVGYGWQRGPQLREVAVPDPSNAGATINQILDANAYRWNFFVAVDIPLLNFYSASR